MKKDWREQGANVSKVYGFRFETEELARDCFADHVECMRNYERTHEGEHGVEVERSEKDVWIECKDELILMEMFKNL